MTDALVFDQGTVVLQGPDRESNLNDYGLLWDERTSEWRAPACAYRHIILQSIAKGRHFEDRAKAYDRVSLTLAKQIIPRPHQRLALEAWLKEKGAGVVCLPTGAGKSILGVMAIVRAQRPSLIVVPTIDLLHQWHDLLSQFLGVPIGLLGGGERKLESVTVSTYDSALLSMESIGNRFGFIIFDEVHHLPAPRYQMIALACLAPFRLGLTATLQRADGQESFVLQNVGPLVYEAQITQMVNEVLSPYDVVSCTVALSDEEQASYDLERGKYVNFVRRQQIAIGTPAGWQEFLTKAAYMPGGKEALAGYRRQKQISQAPEAKFVRLWEILVKHSTDRCIVFTDDNKTAYRIGEQFYLPVLTHKTKLGERRQMLEDFRTGVISVLVTSKVLNEGVDVPEASVAVVFSGSATVREHVQRLGRILRHQPNKRAVLYELISEGTGEQSVQRRRRQHHAYQKFN